MQIEPSASNKVQPDLRTSRLPRSSLSKRNHQRGNQCCRPHRDVFWILPCRITSQQNTRKMPSAIFAIWWVNIVLNLLNWLSGQLWYNIYCGFHLFIGEVLNLKGIVEDKNNQIARRVVHFTLQHPQLNALKSPKIERLVFNLAYRHVNTIGLNAFSEEKKCSAGGVCTRFFIFDTLCRINHSCIPNLEHYTDDDDRIYCVVARPIKAGEQLFINYVSEMEFQSTEERKKYIKETWHFDCKCQKCRSTHPKILQWKYFHFIE